MCYLPGGWIGSDQMGCSSENILDINININMFCLWEVFGAGFVCSTLAAIRLVNLFISNFAFSFHAAWRSLNLCGLALFSSAILMLISYFARSFDGAMTQYMYILGISFGARIHYFCFGHKATKKETFSKGFQLAAVCDLAIHLGCFFCFTRWFRLSHRHVFNKLFVLSHLRNNYKRFELKCLRRANKTPT